MGIWSWKTSSDNLSNVHVCFKKISEWEQFLLSEIKFWLIPRFIWLQLISHNKGSTTREVQGASIYLSSQPQQPFRGGHWAFWAAGTKAITMWLNAPVLALKRWSSVCWSWPFVWKWIARVTVIVKHMIFLCYGTFHFLSLCYRAQCLQQSMISGRFIKLFEYGYAKYLVFDTERFFSLF